MAVSWDMDSISSDQRIGSSIRFVTRETVKTGRYALLGAELPKARRLWFVLHGYGQLASRFLRHFDGCVPPDTCIVAPEGLSRFYRDMPSGDGSHLQHVGATWMTREGRDDDIADTLRWLYGVYDDVLGMTADRPQVGVLAFSQGVATATRWISSSFVHPHAFVAWAGSVATDVDDASMQDALQYTDVVLVTGDNDQFIIEASREAMLERLRGWQPRARGVQYAGGHRLDTDTLRGLLHGLGMTE